MIDIIQIKNATLSHSLPYPGRPFFSTATRIVLATMARCHLEAVVLTQHTAVQRFNEHIGRCEVDAVELRGRGEERLVRAGGGHAW